MARKSTVAKLPKEVLDEVHKLIQGNVSIDDIVARLADLGAERSRSAVGRYKKNYEETFRKLREAKEVAGMWVKKLGEDPGSDLGQLISELLKTVAFGTLNEMSDGEEIVKPQNIMFLGKAIKDLASADKLTADRILKIRAEVTKEAADAAEKIVTEKGLSKDTVQDIKRAILGIRE